FTLNKDTTEVSKLSAATSIEIYPSKIVPYYSAKGSGIAFIGNNSPNITSGTPITNGPNGSHGGTGGTRDLMSGLFGMEESIVEGRYYLISVSGVPQTNRPVLSFKFGNDNQTEINFNERQLIYDPESKLYKLIFHAGMDILKDGSSLSNIPGHVTKIGMGAIYDMQVAIVSSHTDKTYPN